jgi:triosephosphate isomerase
MSAQRPLIVGNWKMNGLGADLAVARKIAAALRNKPSRARVAICAPATLIERLARAVRGSELIIGAEDVAPQAGGPFTGDVSAAMLADAGARMVIVGHFERRHVHSETDDLVARKALAALRSGLEPIICVGETAADRRSGRALEVVCRQAAESTPPGLAGEAFSLAYEPGWAIDGDQVPEPDQIEEMHLALRELLAAKMGRSGGDVQILYGGSVAPSNAASVLNLRDVGGLLVGRASLHAVDFIDILRTSDCAPT